MSPSRYIFPGTPAHMQRPEKLISKSKCMQRHFSNIESLFTSRFYLPKFVLPLFAIREIFRMWRFHISLIKGTEEWDAYSSPAESVVNARWHYGDFVEAKWEQAREAEWREFVKTAASNRTRYEEIEIFLELCLLRGASSAARGARVHKHACTTATHYSQQRHFCGSLREALVCLIRAKWNFHPTVITMTLPRQRITVAKVLFTNDETVSASEAFNIQSKEKRNKSIFRFARWWIKKEL